MKITLVAGGIGAGKLAEGLYRVLDPRDLTIVVNVGDDSRMHGLYICPDFDIITYTLAGLVDPEKRWGLAGDTFNCLSMLAKYTLNYAWFNLGDKDMGTHVFRTSRLDEGARLTEVARTIRASHGVNAEILPCTDDEVRTRVRSGDRWLEFEEYFVKERAGPVADEIAFSGADQARITPEVRDALENTDKIVIAPSNPYLSIDPILAIRDMRAIMSKRKGDACFVSPIVGNDAIKGPTAKIMKERGVEPSCVSVASHYKDVASVAFIDAIDARRVPEVESMGYEVFTHDTVMVDMQTKVSLARFMMEKLGSR